MNPENFGIIPNPSKDQHFLTDSEIIKDIVKLSGAAKGDIILEIGAGIGTLTYPLSKTKAKIIAVEMDKRMNKALKKIKSSNVEILYENVLRIIDKLKFNKIVSNTPYSICEPLMNKLLRRNFETAVVSFPQGFYESIISDPGSDNYSMMSLKYQSFFEMLFKFKIPKDAFDPQPRTETVVATIKPLTKKYYSENPDKYITREIILQKTKKIKNSLAEALINYNKKIMVKDFNKRSAKEVVKLMKLSENLLEKKSMEMTIRDFGKIIKKLHAPHVSF